jgi:hypothetical protein
MNNGKGLAVPKKSETKNSTIFEELSTVKLIGNKVLMQQSVCVNEEVVARNMNWRATTYDSFQKRVHLVAEDYTGGIDDSEIIIEPPMIMDVLDENGDRDPDSKVIVNFTAIIPTNIGRKELH